MLGRCCASSFCLQTFVCNRLLATGPECRVVSPIFRGVTKSRHSVLEKLKAMFRLSVVNGGQKLRALLQKLLPYTFTEHLHTVYKNCIIEKQIHYRARTRARVTSVPNAVSSSFATSANASASSISGLTTSPTWGTKKKVAKADKELEALLEVYGGVGGVL